MVIGCYGNICCCFFVGQKLKCDFWVFWIKMCCTLHSKIIQSVKIFILVMVEGISGRWCLRYWKNFPVPCTGTIGVQSQKFEKSEKLTFFKWFLILFFWIFLTLLESSRVKRMLRKILVFSLCESYNSLLSSGCLTMIFGIWGVLDTKCVVEHKWVYKFFPYTDVRRTLGVDVHRLEWGIYVF